LQIDPIEGCDLALFAIELASKPIDLNSDFCIDSIHDVP